jgi:Magnesium chelatase, subunit ChlI
MNSCTRIHSVAGLTDDRTASVTTRPFRAPHHPISDAGLIGGGQVPMPGEVSLAHHGVLFLDAWPECRRHVLEVWSQPLEESVLYRQSPARCRPRDVGGVRQTDDDHEGCRPRTVATRHRDGHHPRGVPASLIRSRENVADQMR